MNFPRPGPSRRGGEGRRPDFCLEKSGNRFAGRPGGPWGSLGGPCGCPFGLPGAAPGAPVLRYPLRGLPRLHVCDPHALQGCARRTLRLSLGEFCLQCICVSILQHRRPLDHTAPGPHGPLGPAWAPWALHGPHGPGPGPMAFMWPGHKALCCFHTRNTCPHARIPVRRPESGP